MPWGSVTVVAGARAARAVVAAAAVDERAVDDGEAGAVATLPASGPVQAPAARSTARAASTGAARAPTGHDSQYDPPGAAAGQARATRSR